MDIILGLYIWVKNTCRTILKVKSFSSIVVVGSQILIELYIHCFRIMAIEIPGGKRNLNMNINAQQAILNAYITNNSSLYKIYSANVSLLHRNIIRAI